VSIGTASQPAALATATAAPQTQLVEAAAAPRPRQPLAEPVSAPAAATPAQPPVPVAVDRALPAQPIAPAAPTAPPLAGQLARPVFTLAAAGSGEHVMTVHVTPDTLGPVTVRAHVGGEGVRVELFAPTDAGRDALRAILPDLRRDLSGAGLSGSLDLSSQNQPSPQREAPGDGRGYPGRGRDEPGPRAAPTASIRSTPAAPADGLAHTIDLIV
jgi:flagellar hook-length control protein FliK